MKTPMGNQVFSDKKFKKLSFIIISSGEMRCKNIICEIRFS